MKTQTLNRLIPTLVLALTTLAGSWPANVAAATDVLNTGVTDLSTAANWSLNAVPGTTSEALISNNNTATALSISAAQTYGDLVINNSTLTNIIWSSGANGNWTVQWGTNSGSSAAITAGGATGDAIVLGNNVTGAVTIGGQSGAGTMTLGFTGGNIDVVNSSATLAITANTTGAVTKTGAGALTLSPYSSSSFSISLNSGTLNVNSAAAISAYFTNTGGTLNNTSGTAIIDGLSAVTLNGDLTFAGGGSGTSSDLTLKAGSGNNDMYLGTATNTSTSTTRTITVTAANSTLGLWGNFLNSTNGNSVVVNSITKEGAGALLLQNGSRFSGGATLNNGTIVIGAAYALGNTNAGGATNWANMGALTINGGGVAAWGATNASFSVQNAVVVNKSFFLGSDANSGALKFNGTNVSLGAATNTWTVNNSTEIATIITGTGGLIKAGSGTLSLSVIGSTFTGDLTVNSGVFKVAATDNTSLGSGTSALTLNGGEVHVYVSSGAAKGYNRNTTVAGDSKFMVDNSGGGGGGVVMGTLNIGAQTFTTYAGSSTNQQAITLAFGATTMSGASVITANNGTAGGNFTLTLASLNNGGFTPTFNGSGNIYMTGAITNNGGLIKNGTGTLTLNGANTYGGVSGVTAINAGNLTITAIGALPGYDTSGRYSVASGATLAVYNAVTDAQVATMLGTGNFAAGSAIGFDTTSGARTNANNFSGTYGLTKVGTGNLTLSGSNSFSGNTTISSGILTITTTNALPGYATSGRYSVANGATLAVYNAVTDANVASMLATTNFAAGSAIGFDTTTANRTYSTSITNTAQGALGLTKTGANTLTLSGSNSFTGNTAVAAGVLALGDANALSGSTFAGGAGTLSFGSLTAATFGGLGSANNLALTNGSGSAVSLTVGGNNSSSTNAGIISGSGSLTKVGTGNLTLSGSNSFSGNTTISSGILTITTTNGLPGYATSGKYSVANGATLAVANTGFTDANITNMIYGTTNFAAGSAIGIDIISGSVRVLSPIITNTAQGALGLTKTGLGILTITNAQTYTGTTTIAAGTLQLGNSINLAAASLSTNSTIVDNGTLNIYRNNQVTQGTDFSGAAISGTGGITMTGGSGAGTLTLTAANTYTGTTLINGGKITITGNGTLGATNSSVSIYSTLDLGGLTRTNSGGFTISVGGVFTNGTLIADTYNLNGGTIAGNLGAGAITVATGATTLGSAGRFNGASSLNITSAQLSLGGNESVNAFTISYGALGGTGTLTAATYALNGGSILANLGAGAITVASGTTTLNGTAAANSVKINSGGLTLGGNNRLSSSAAVTNNGGTLNFGSYTNSIGSLVLTTGSTLSLAANQTSSAQIAASGAVNFGSGNTLDLTGMSNTLGLYKLVSGSSLTNTFGTVTGLDSNYLLKYGTVTANELDAQHKATFGTVTATVSTNAIITGGTTGISFLVNNSAVTNSAALSFSATGGSGVTGSASGTANAQAGSGSVTGLTFTGSGVGSNKAVAFTLNDASATTTSANGSTAVDVYGHAAGSVNSSNISVGNFHVGYGATNISSLLTASNTGSYVVNLGANSASNGPITLGAVSGVAQGTTGAVSVGLAAGQTAGAINNSLTYTFKDDSSLNGSSANVGTANVNVTGGVYNYAAATLASSNVNLGNIHAGSTFVAQNLNLSNSATGPAGYVENLSGSFTNGSGVTGAGSVSGLASGSSSTALSVNLTDTTAGAKSGSIGVALGSQTLTGETGLANSSLAGQTINVTGGVYNYAAATLASSNVNLGNIHVGGTFGSSNLSLNNSATGPANYVENLGASFGSGSGATGTGSFTGLASGATNNGLSVSLSGVATAGTNNGSIALNLNSEAVNGSGLGTTTLTGKTVAVSGFGYTGQGVYNTAGGSWGTFGNWQQAGGYAGLDGSLSANDTATFGTGGSGVVTLDGAAPSIQTLSFSNASSGYTLTQGTGGSLTLKTGDTAASINNNAGSHTISANVILANDTTLNAASGTELNISGAVSGSGSGLTKEGAGTATLSGDNTYTGQTVVSDGTLQIGNGGTSGTLGSGAVVDNGSLVLNRSDAVTLANTISGTGSFTQAGTGSVTLNAVETFTGKTTVSAGTLILGSGASLASTEINLGTRASQGTLDASALRGGITIGDGQTLGGYGTLVGNTTIASGGTLAPGNSPGVIGITGDLTLTGGSTSTFQVYGLGGAGAINGFDQVNVSGALTYGGVLKLDITGSYNTGTAFQNYLFNFGSQTGAFSSVKYSLNGSAWTDLNYYAANNTWQMWNNSALTLGADNGYIGINLDTGYLTVVPEPSTWALFGLGALVLVIAARRRKA